MSPAFLCGFVFSLSEALCFSSSSLSLSVLLSIRRLKTCFIQKIFLFSPPLFLCCRWMHNVKGKPLCKVHVTRSRLASEVSARCCVVDDCHITFTDAKLIAEEFHAIRDECACVVAGDVPGGPCSAYFLVCHSAHLVSLCLGSLLRRAGRRFIQRFFTLINSLT